MRLLFLAVLRRHTGNAVTAERVRDHLEAAGHVCLLKDAFDLESSSEVAHLIRAENLEAALALHLYRGGRLLQGHGIPFGIIFGGTDLNEDVKQREKNEVMGRVLGEARFAVAFTESMKETAQTQWCVHVLIKILLEIKMQKARQISRAVPCAAGGTDPWELKRFNVTQRMETSSVPEPRRPPSQDHDLRAQTSGMTRIASNSSNHQSTEWQGELLNNINNPQPHARDKIYIQSQGVMTVPNAAFNWNTFLHRSGINQSADNLHIFLLVCGLRQVKDPLYLVDAFSEWHREEPNVYMVIVGPELASLGDVKMNSCGRQIRKSLMQYNLYAIRSTTLKYNPAVFSIFMQFADVTLVRVDPVFTREVKAKVKRTAGVRLLGEMPQGDLHAALRNCFAVVNSSMSEGMSAAILEAMDLEVPVLARNIPGNAAVVKHEVTGLLFSDPQDFVQLAKRLVHEPALEKELVANGREYVRRYHSWQAERDTYQNLVRTLEGSTGE